MFKLLFLVHYSRPSVMIKRTMDELYYRNLGQQMKRKAEMELNKLERPVYKISYNKT